MIPSAPAIRIVLTAVTAAFVLSLCTDSAVASPPGSGPWTLTFFDDFLGSSLDPNVWTIRTTPGSSADNVTVSGGALHLAITANPSDPLHPYTIGRVDTHGPDMGTNLALWSQRYGYFEARMRPCPTEQTDATFWMQSYPGTNNVDQTGHDGCEIDIVETMGSTSSNGANATIHYDGYPFATLPSGTLSFKQDSGSGTISYPNLHDGNYHLFGLEWAPTYLKFYYDNVLMWTYTGPGVPYVKECLILSTGYATYLPGNIANATLPYYEDVDYVKAWSTTYSTDPLPPASYNLVANGDFEATGTSPWVSWNTTGLDTQHFYNGEQCGYVTKSSSLTQTLSGLSPNTDYVYSVHAAVQNTGDSVQVGVNNYGGAEISRTVTSTSYQWVRIPFRTGATSTSAQVYIYKSGATGSGQAFIDDVSVNHSFAANGDFETGAVAPWVVWSNAGISSTAANTGTRCGYVSNLGCLTQTITGLLPNTMYRLTAYVRLQNSNNTAYFGVKNYGASEVCQTVTNASGFAKRTIFFKTGSSSTSADVYLAKPENSGTGDGYIDDVEVVQQ